MASNQPKINSAGYTLVFVAVTFLGAEATSPPQPLTVPARPEDVTLQKSSLFYLWNQQQHFEDTFPVQRDTRGRRMVSSKDYSIVYLP